MKYGTYSTDLGLGSIPETKDKQNFADLLRIYNAIRALANNLDAYTGNVPAAVQLNRTFLGSPICPPCVAGVVLAVGSCVSFATSTTTLTATLADAGLGIAPQGINLSGGATVGSSNSPVIHGPAACFTGLAPGQVYYLQAAGAIGLAPTAYPVGFAINPTTLWVNL